MQRCTEGYGGAQIYVEVHKGVTEVHGGMYGGARRWTEGCLEVDRECSEVCRGLYRGMQSYVEVKRGLQRYVEVHEKYVEGVRRCKEVHGGVCRCVIEGMEGAWRCTKVYGGVQRGTEIGRGVQRCTEVCVSVLRGVWSSKEMHGVACAGA